MRRFLILILLLGISASAQIKRFTISPAYAAADTTTNIYVNSVSGDDGNDGLTFATAKLTSSSAQSLVNAPTDTIFYYGTFDSLSFYVNANFCAYNLTNKPLVTGIDTISNFDYIEDVAIDYDTIEVDFTNTSLTLANSSGVFAYRMTITPTHGYLYGYVIRIKNQTYYDGTIKISLGTRSNDTIYTITDSCLVNGASWSSGYLSADGFVNYLIYGDNGRYISEDSIWVVAVQNRSSTYLPIGYNDTNGLTWFYSYASGNYTAFPLSAYKSYGAGYLAQKRDYAVGLILKTTVGTGDYTKLYAVFPDTVYQVFLNETAATMVADKGSVDATGKAYYGSDSLWIYYTDSLNVTGIVRDGIILENTGSVNNFKFEKTRAAIRAAGTIGNVEINGNRFTKNLYGIADSSDGIGFYHNNIFDNNGIGLQAVNKDTAKAFNNTFRVEGSGLSDSLSFRFINSPLKFVNNATYNSKRIVGYIDLLNNIAQMSNNSYAYYYGQSGAFINTDSTNYDSLAQFQTASAWDVNSFHSRSSSPYPYNSQRFVDRFNGDFHLKNRDIVGDTTYSPLVDAGISVPYVSKDFEHNSIPYNSTPDIGAYEWTPQGATMPYNFAINISDSSAYLTWENLNNEDSTVIYSSDDGVTYTTVATIKGTAYQVPLTGKSGIDAPTVSNFTLANETETSGTFNARIQPNDYANGRTSLRIEYGIGNFNTYTTYIDTTAYMADVKYFKLRNKSPFGLSSAISGETASAIPTLNFTIPVTSLSASTYQFRLYVYNSGGSAYSSTVTHTFGGAPPFESVYYFHPDSARNSTAHFTALIDSLAPGDSVILDGIDWQVDDPLVINNLGEPYNSTYIVFKGLNGARITTVKPFYLDSTAWTKFTGSLFFDYNWNGVVDAGETVSPQNVWEAVFSTNTDKWQYNSTDFFRIYFNGDRPGYNPRWASNVYYSTIGLGDDTPAWCNYDGGRIISGDVTSGNRNEDTWWVNSNHRFTLERKNTQPSKIYIYSPDNVVPQSYAWNQRDGEITFTGQVSLTGGKNRPPNMSTLRIMNSWYIKLDGIKIEGGLDQSVQATNTPHLYIDNCEIGRHSGEYGIYINSGAEAVWGSNCDSITIKHTLFDSGEDMRISSSANLSRFGTNAVDMGQPNSAAHSKHIVIDSCEFRLWHCAVLSVETTSGFANRDLRVSNSYFNGNQGTYMKPFQVNDVGVVYFYNNRMDSCATHAQPSVVKHGSIISYTLANGGTGYHVNDYLTIKYSGASGGKIKVTGVDGSGTITSHSLYADGTLYKVANNLTTTVSPTGGTGALINITAVETGTSIDSIYVFNNIWKSTELCDSCPTNVHDTGIDAFAWLMQSYWPKPNYHYFFNNTIYDSRDGGIFIPNNQVYLLNNLILNSSYYQEGISQVEFYDFSETKSFINNIFGFIGKTSSLGVFATVNPVSLKTVAEINSQGGVGSFTASGNAFTSDAYSSIINMTDDNFGSVINTTLLQSTADTSTSAMKTIYQQVADVNGNLNDYYGNPILVNWQYYDAKKPNIGAVNNK